MDDVKRSMMGRGLTEDDPIHRDMRMQKISMG